jgi:hypothetical protein
MSETSPGERRRVTVARAYAAATRTLQRSAALLSGHPGHPDAALLTACVAYGRIRRRVDRFGKAGTRTMSGEALEQAHADLHAAGSSLLVQVAAHRAVTLDGHRARAAAFLAWDEGELIGLADRCGILQDRLIIAMLADLIVL